MMSTKKIVTVFGATGIQGGSVIESILGDAKASSQFAIRGITRDATKSSAKALAAKGVEVVTANMNDAASISAAIKGSYAVFAVTNYWEKMDAELEEKQGRAIADAASEHGVQHYIWSTLNDISKASKGVLNEVYHFDAKARVDDYIKKLGIPTTFYLPGLYFSNLPGKAIQKNAETGVYELGLPIQTDTKLPMLATEYDTGKFIKGILLKREKTLGKRIYGAQAYYTIQELMNIFAKAKPEVGSGAKAVVVTDGAYKAALAPFLPPLIKEELLQNWKLNDPNAGGPGYYNGEDLKDSQSILDETLMTWEEYVMQAPAYKDVL